MPQVPTATAPSQSQNGGPIGVQAPADAFGGNIAAAGLAGLGKTSSEISTALADHAEKFQAINNKAEADGAFVTHLQAINKYSAEFQANNLGIKASQNLGDAMTTLNKQRDDIEATLSNPMAKAMFNADSRRALANTTGELTRFSVSQRKQYIVKQSSAVQEALASDTVIHPESFDANMAQMMMQQASINDQLGLSEEEGALAAKKLYGNTVQMVSKTLAGSGDVQAASAFLEAHKAGMDGKIYADTLMQLKPALQANDAATMAHEAYTDAVHGLGTGMGASVDYLSHVHDREGSGKNPYSTADGVGQFTEGTWKLMMKKPEFADVAKGKTDAELLALRHNPEIANRAILAYGDDNANYLQSKGLPVNSATIGLAHGYGPEGAEKILKSPGDTKVETIIGEQTAKNNRVYGMTTTQVVQGFTKRFGTGSTDSASGGPPTSVELQSRMQAGLDIVDAKVQAKYGDNAVIRDQAQARFMTELNRQVAAAKDRETSAFTTLASVAMNDQIQDLPTLLQTVPGGLQMYNTLPISQRTALQSGVHRNATEMTAGRVQNINTLNGMYGSRLMNPQAFLDAPIATMDLPLGQKIDFLKKQAELRGKPATADPSSKALAAIVKTPEYRSILGTDGLDIKPNSDDEYALRGAVAGQLTAWLDANPGKTPAPKDISQMLVSATSQHAYHDTFFGFQVSGTKVEQKVPEIPEEDRTAIIAALTKHNIPVTPFTINKYYSMGKGGN